MLLAELADRSAIQWIEVIDHFLAQAKRGPDRDGETKRVEERQDAQQHLVGAEVDLLLDLMDVAEDIAVRKDDALGIAGRSGGEDHGRLGVEVVAAKARYESAQRLDRYQLGDRGGPQFIGQPHLLGDVFQEDELALGRDLEFVEHLGRGQDVRDAALVDRGIHQALAGRVVQIDRDSSPERNRDVGHRRGDGRWNQQPDSVARTRRFAPARVPGPGHG